jgi:hypothetical protein
MSVILSGILKLYFADRLLFNLTDAKQFLNPNIAGAK